MTDTTIVAMPPATAHSYVDWGPVFGGALVATALSFVLFSFGSAAGVASVSPYSWNNPSLTTLSVVATAWCVVVMIASFLAGGYFAGRLRRPSGDAGPEERERRDGAHGLIVWALGLLIGAGLAAMVAGATLHGAASAVGSAGGAAAGSLGPDRLAGIVDTMLRAAPSANGAATARGEDPRAEVTRIIATSTRSGSVSDADRTYLAQLVAARAGIAEDEARRRVDAAIEQAKDAANTARKMAALVAFLIGASSLLSAGAACWGATAGGRHRDEALMSGA